MNGVFKVELNGEARPRRPLPEALQTLHEENFWASISLSGMQKYALFLSSPWACFMKSTKIAADARLPA